MSETAIKKKTYDCPNCGNPIGKLFEVADGSLCLLDTGGGDLEIHHQGMCKTCGQAVYWDINQQKLDRLIKGTNPLDRGQDAA